MTPESELTLIKKLQLYLIGVTVVKTSRGNLYYFKCPKHGIVSTYRVKGYRERLECPQCLEEIRGKKNDN
jgi:hypothetical protein